MWGGGELLAIDGLVLVGPLVGRLVSWLVGWIAGWLAGESRWFSVVGWAIG